MKTLQVAIAAARRYRLERPLRDEWNAIWTLQVKRRVACADKKRLPFYMVLMKLVDAKKITKEQASDYKKQYTRLSKIIHES